MYCKLLPKDEDNYRRLIKKFFPNIYDVKFMLRHAQKLRDRGTVTGNVASLLQSIGTKSGLQDISDELGCVRNGIQHTAGSDAWLTGQVWFELRKRLFDSTIPVELNGQMWGITGVGPPAPATAQAAALAALQNAASNAAANGGGQGTFGGGGTAGFLHREGQGRPSTPTAQGAFGGSGTGVFGNFQYGGK